ncbi:MULTISPECIES: response regulator transcription factor [Alphaproteobacteria]|uniref:response regulator transcription factor n=1 Tax=Alphaproteobacteria TaxID=28211 RepID=UPI003A93E365
MRILLIEDNLDIGEAISVRLTRHGHHVTHIEDGTEGEHIALAGGNDVLILDINLPGRNGFQILGALRRSGMDTPTLVLTARNQTADKIDLLDLGADDYLVKPFDMDELEARLRAVSRRSLGSAQSVIEKGRLSIDLNSRAVMVDGSPVDLGKRETEVLEVLLSRFGQTVNKDALVLRLFAHDDQGSPNAIELLVSRLRRKIVGSDLEIITQRGVGYLIREKSGS